jgi:hypothetical protein
MQKRLPQFTSYHILFLLIGMCFYYTPIKAQFTNLGPTGSSTYKATGSSFSNGTGQIHCFGIPFGYQYGTLCPNASNVLYAGSPYSGLWKSVDGGDNWIRNTAVASTGLEVNSVNDIAIENKCPDYSIYIATGVASNSFLPGQGNVYSCGIYKSDNYGQSFYPVTGFNSTFNFSTSNCKYTRKIAISPFNPNLVFVATSDGLYRSTNATSASSTWQLVHTVTPISNEAEKGIWTVEFSPNDSNMVYCSAGRNIYYSSTKGSLASFYPLNTNTFIANTVTDGNGTFNLKEANVNFKVVNVAGSDKIYTSTYVKYYNNSASTRIFSLYLGTWLLHTPVGSPFYNVVEFPTFDRVKIDISPTSTNTVIAGYTQTKKTTDAGTTWSDATTYGGNAHADIHAIQFLPNGVDALIGTDGGIYKYNVTNDASTELYNGLSLSFTLGLSTSSTKKGYLVMGKNDTNFDWYDGLNWHQGGSGGDGNAAVVWDKSYDNQFYYNINGDPSFSKFDISNQTTQYISNTGCLLGGLNGNDFQKSFFQNPNPDKRDEFYTPSKKGIKISNEPTAHLTNYKLMDEENDYSTLELQKIFVSKGYPDYIYTWQTAGHPAWDNVLLYRFNRSNYFNYNTSCTKAVGLNCTYNGTNCYETLKPFDAPYYISNIPCKQFPNSTPQNAPRANYFPISGTATSNTDNTKIWVSIAFNRERYSEMTTLFPGQKKHKIRKSVNNGASFTDDDAGLPDYPITNILYVDGSDDALFCSTFNGRVYWKDNTHPTWTELDPNLPRNQISVMEIKYCERKLYVGLIGGGVWVYDLSNGTPALSALKISGTVNWTSTSLDIGSNIDILPGGTLKITGSTINMGKGTKITLEKGTTTLNGGKLLISSNSIVTNACGELWKGIEVLGDPAKQQLTITQLAAVDPSTSSKQGIVSVLNSTIENMELGINLNTITNGTTANGGGQLFAISSTFRNNLTAINANNYAPSAAVPGYYQGYTRSKVEQCTFTNTIRPDFLRHILLTNIKGFQVRGCVFDNSTVLLMPNGVYRIGTGIYGVDATAEIVNARPNGLPDVPNQFSNFNYGVYFTHSTPLGDASFHLKVSQCNFSNNAFGVYLNGVNYPAVVSNTIAIPQLPKVNIGGGFPNPPLYVNTKTYGIYLTACKSYQVQNNTISSTPSTPNCNGCLPAFNTGPAYGILVNNGSSLAETVRKNTLTGLNYGLTAVGINGASATGLLFQCNALNANQNYDIWLTENVVNGTTTNGSIRNQGTAPPGLPTDASDNQFNQLSSTVPSYQLIRSSLSSTYTYFYYQNDPVKIPSRVYSSNVITLNQFGVSSNCLDNVLATEYTPSAALQIPIVIASIKSKLKQDEVYYNNQLARVSSADMGELLDSIAAEPFVAKAVLYKVIQHPLVANYFDKVLALLQTHAGRDDSTAYYLSKANLPFTKTTLATLKTSWLSQPSSEQKAIEKANALEAELEAMIKTEVDRLIEITAIDSALKILKSYPSANMQQLYAEVAMQFGTNNQKQAAIASLLSYPNATVSHHLGEYYTLLNNSNGRSSSLEEMYKIYNYGDAAAFKAAAFIALVSDSVLAPYLPNQETETPKFNKEVVNYWNEITLGNSIVLEVYPSPANNRLTVYYQISDAKEVKIEAFDMQGKLVYSNKQKEQEGKLELNSTNWQAGNYFIRVSDVESKESKSDKVTIVH